MPQEHENDERSDDRSWPGYRKLILALLERIEQDIREINQRIEEDGKKRSVEMTDMKVQIAMLQVKCGIWGGLSGVVSALGVSLLKLMH